MFIEKLPRVVCIYFQIFGTLYTYNVKTVRNNIIKVQVLFFSNLSNILKNVTNIKL